MVGKERIFLLFYLAETGTGRSGQDWGEKRKEFVIVLFCRDWDRKIRPGLGWEKIGFCLYSYNHLRVTPGLPVKEYNV